MNLAHRTMLQRQTPRTLAETASAFCQTIVQKAGVEQADAQEQLGILDGALQFLLMIVVDTTTWFLFEKKLCEQRLQGPLSVENLKELMLEVQREVYGDGLDQDLLHPYTWLAWPHLFWDASEGFYNFQYPFGTLFGMGLYAQWRDQPEAFKARYDDLLSSTGMGSPAELVKPFGIDIRSPAFWRSSLDVIRADIDRFEALVNRSQ
jgi:oligoendopeptidase F